MTQIPIRSFEIFQGDIVDCGCTVIVNSANTRIAMGSGVAGRLHKLCGGPTFQQKVSAELALQYPDEDSDGSRLRGKLPRGEALVTDAGDLTERFRAVIHVAAVDYDLNPCSPPVTPFPLA
jgi:O-acetyl-ADP-ribose deacetylase (regulator of RNase III)